MAPADDEPTTTLVVIHAGIPGLFREINDSLGAGIIPSTAPPPSTPHAW
jgi:hypothetical protein